MRQYRVDYRPEISDDVQAIYEYIVEEKHNRFAADKFVTKIIDEMESLKIAPMRGRIVGSDKRTNLDIRYITYHNYGVCFEVDDKANVVTVVAVTYARRNIASLLRGRL